MNITHSLLIEGDEDNDYVLSWQTNRSGPGPDNIKDVLTKAATRYYEGLAAGLEFPPEEGLNVGDVVNSTEIYYVLRTKFGVQQIDLTPVCRPTKPWNHDDVLATPGC